jgi:hypothetical protein
MFMDVFDIRRDSTEEIFGLPIAQFVDMHTMETFSCT